MAEPLNSGLCVFKKKKRFVTPTETNVHGDALCFTVETWAMHKTMQALLNNGWRLVVGGGWRLAVDGGWRSLGAVLKDKRSPEGWRWLESGRFEKKVSPP